MATDSTTSGASTPSNPYQNPSDQNGSQPLVVVGQQITQAINALSQVTTSGTLSLTSLTSSIIQAFRPATSSASPLVTGVNNIGTTAVAVIGANTGRHGLLFHNPATTNVNVYVFSSTAATTPTLSAPGGAIVIFPAATFAFPASEYANVTIGFSAFASTGTNNALTIMEFL